MKIFRLLLLVASIASLASGMPLERQTASQICVAVLGKRSLPRQTDPINPENNNNIDPNAPQENAQDPSGCVPNEMFGRCHLDGVYDAYICNLACQCVYTQFGSSAGGCFYDSNSVLDVGSNAGCTLYPLDFPTGCTCDAAVGLRSMGGVKH
jgi:hypothetical protein